MPAPALTTVARLLPGPAQCRRNQRRLMDEPLLGRSTGPRPGRKQLGRLFQASNADSSTDTVAVEVVRAAGGGLDDPNPPPGNGGSVWSPMVVLAFTIPALGGLLFGYDIGAASGALVNLTNPSLAGVDWSDLSPLQSGLVVSSSVGGALLGSLVALAFGEQLGRNRELIGAGVLYAVSGAMALAAPSLPVLIAARVTYGLGIGLAMHAAPMYIAETAPASVRGLLISLKEGFIVGGILLGYLAGFVFIGEPGGWRAILSCSAPAALILIGGMLWLPPSPRWVVLRGLAGTPDGALLPTARREALDAVGRLRQADLGLPHQRAAVEAEVDDMARTAAAAAAEQQAAGGAAGDGGYAELLRGRNGRALAVGLSLMLFQQITGQPSVLAYANQTFQQAGIGRAQDAAEVAVLLGSFKLLMTGVAVAKVDTLGRRPLLLWGVSGMAVALIILGVAETVEEGGFSDFLTQVSVLALLLYVGCYQLSFGPISWLIVGEVFPLSVRGRAMGVATLVNFGGNFAVSLALPSLQATLGIGHLYLGFAAVTMAAVATIYYTVPETKGRTLEEIEELFDGRDPTRAPDAK